MFVGGWVCGLGVVRVFVGRVRVGDGFLKVYKLWRFFIVIGLKGFRS